MTKKTAKPKAPDKSSEKTTRNGGGQVQSLVRGLSILECLAEAKGGMNLTEISDYLGLAPSTAHRLLNSLEQQGFVAQDQARGNWYIGVKAFSVGNAFLRSRDFVAIVRPFMHDLVAQTGETSNLAILDGGVPVFIAQVECSEMMRMVATLGSKAPVHASGVGKALLCQRREAEVEAIIAESGLPVLGPNTITSPEEFRAELKRIRQQGYSFDNEEQSVGLRCVASNIYNEHGEAVAAISISGPAPRITDERVPVLGRLLAETARAATEALGGRLPQ